MREWSRIVAVGSLAASVASCDARMTPSGEIPSLETETLRAFTDATREWGSVLAHGDVNGDDVADIIIGCPALSNTVKGLVVVLDGRTQRTSALLLPPRGNDVARAQRFGAAVTVADFDGDGFGDLAVGNPTGGVDELDGSGAVHLYPGPLDPERFEIVDPGQPRVNGAYGSSLCVLDFDRDGLADLAVGEPAVDAETLEIRSGPDLTTIRRFESPQPGNGFASALADEGEGRLFIGAPRHRDENGAERGVAYQLTESMDAPLLIERPLAENAEYAASATRGDFDGDGAADRLVSALAGDDAGIYLDAGNGDRVRFTLSSSVGPRPGARVITIGDRNGDGREDVLLLSSRRGEASALLYSTPQFRTHILLDEPIAGALVADFDDDGEDELLLSAPWNYRKDPFGLSLLLLVEIGIERVES